LGFSGMQGATTSGNVIFPLWGIGGVAPFLGVNRVNLLALEM
jgi:hypothetical protein